MDLIQATRRELFTVHNRTATFIHPSAAVASDRQPRLTVQVSSKERSANVSILFVIVASVGLLHAFGIRCFFWQESVEALPSKPMITEVSMISIPIAKPEAAPKKTPLIASNQSTRKKIQRKPKLKKQARAAHGMAFSAREQVLLQQLIQDFDIRQFAIDQPTREASAQTQPYTEAHLDATYDHILKPDYPSIARSRGWHGQVLLRVQVNEEGKVESIDIEKSSSYELLDESAVEAVKRWVFVPAMRGNTAVATSVLVPIIFALQS